MEQCIDCIFCLETININGDVEEAISDCNKGMSNIEVYSNKISDILNSNLELNCNHNYHLGCFAKYLKFKYKSWNQLPEIERIKGFTLECPCCRGSVLMCQIIYTIDKMKSIRIIQKVLQNKLLMTKMKLLWTKLKIYSKYALQISNKEQMNSYFYLSEAYDEYEFLNSKITYLVGDLDTMYEDINKYVDYDYDHLYY
jgi:hypothetical protein